MTYKELEVGQKFRLINWPKTEWVKTEPTVDMEQQRRYNAIGDNGRYQTIGHSAKVMLPPYTATALSSAQKQRKRYGDYLARVQAAGWKSPAELETAIINGVISVPAKP